MEQVDGRTYVLPDDIRALAAPVLAHRPLTTAESQIGRRSSTQVVHDILRSIPLPSASR